MKRFLLLALLVAAAIPVQANAAVPCRDKIFNDWYADGRIASTYPHACYVDALHHIPPDAKVYSSLGDDITAAMRASLRRAEGKVVPKQVGHGFTAQNALATSTMQPHDPSVGEPTAASSSAPVSSASSSAPVSSSSSTPVPILVLGGLAIALAAAGAIGTGVKYARSRRR
jgi:hypothetical protein